MTSPQPELNVSVPEESWLANDDSGHSLVVRLTVNGLAMHLEAWEVLVDDAGLQVPASSAYDEEFAELHHAVSADGHFQTVTIRGREYILVASPHCN